MGWTDFCCAILHVWFAQNPFCRSFLKDPLTGLLQEQCMNDVKRRRPPSSHRPRDRREVIIVHGDEVSYEDYKGMTAEVVMDCFDRLMPPYRALCNEYNLNACEVADLAQLGKTPE
jgi:hypothetical protein